MLLSCCGLRSRQLRTGKDATHLDCRISSTSEANYGQEQPATKHGATQVEAGSTQSAHSEVLRLYTPHHDQPTLQDPKDKDVLCSAHSYHAEHQGSLSPSSHFYPSLHGHDLQTPKDPCVSSQQPGTSSPSQLGTPLFNTNQPNNLREPAVPSMSSPHPTIGALPLCHGLLSNDGISCTQQLTDILPSTSGPSGICGGYGTTCSSADYAAAMCVQDLDLDDPDGHIPGMTTPNTSCTSAPPQYTSLEMPLRSAFHATTPTSGTQPPPTLHIPLPRRLYHNSSNGARAKSPLGMVMQGSGLGGGTAAEHSTLPTDTAKSEPLFKDPCSSASTQYQEAPAEDEVRWHHGAAADLGSDILEAEGPPVAMLRGAHIMLAPASCSSPTAITADCITVCTGESGTLPSQTAVARLLESEGAACISEPPLQMSAHLSSSAHHATTEHESEQDAPVGASTPHTMGTCTTPSVDLASRASAPDNLDQPCTSQTPTTPTYATTFPASAPHTTTASQELPGRDSNTGSVQSVTASIVISDSATASSRQDRAILKLFESGAILLTDDDGEIMTVSTVLDNGSQGHQQQHHHHHHTSSPRASLASRVLRNNTNLHIPRELRRRERHGRTVTVQLLSTRTSQSSEVPPNSLGSGPGAVSASAPLPASTSMMGRPLNKWASMGGNRSKQSSSGSLQPSNSHLDSIPEVHDEVACRRASLHSADVEFEQHMTMGCTEPI